jgi:hypothetical protein
MNLIDDLFVWLQTMPNIVSFDADQYSFVAHPLHRKSQLVRVRIDPQALDQRFQSLAEDGHFFWGQDLDEREAAWRFFAINLEEALGTLPVSSRNLYLDAKRGLLPSDA